LALALFDLDNTLLNGDSDHSWGLYLAELGVVDPESHRQRQDYFYQQYTAGTLDILDFLEFQLAPLAQHSVNQLLIWRSAFIEEIIKPMIASGKPELIEPHRQNNDTLVIITATNDFITQPIADLLGVSTLIATQVEFKDAAYTGKITGAPCFQKGKIERLNQWLDHPSVFDKSYFYSDSINDLPLLALVDHPVAVTPDDKLRSHAQQQGWDIID
jgi:HAD superfamily hydrolase (TIGR01490 family)